MRIHIYSDKVSTRLEYIVQFIFEHYFKHTVELHTEQDDFNVARGLKINYSTKKNNASHLQITPHTLLFEEHITDQQIKVSKRNDLPCFFESKINTGYPFDIFAASFYLLTRYEEYLPHTKDEFDRYAHANSIAFKHNFLHLPLIELWLQVFQQKLFEIDEEINLQTAPYKFIPTYDVDIAYSYKYKGFKRTIGGYCKDLSQLKIGALLNRAFCRIGLFKDPYDSYSLIQKTHKKNGSRGIFFFLSGQNGPLDKNIPIEKKAMQQLIENMAIENDIGIHPSYQSNDTLSLIQIEREKLGNVLGKRITKSRQHYIKFSLPATYTYLEQIGIQEEYSMGYGSINGFRASTSIPHPWFNLSKNTISELRIYPFCFMDCNSKFEQAQDLETTKKEIEHYTNIVKQVNGTLVSIWHNFSLGSERQWKGWKKLYVEQIEISIVKKEGLITKIKNWFQ